MINIHRLFDVIPILIQYLTIGSSKKSLFCISIMGFLQIGPVYLHSITNNLIIGIEHDF